MSEITQQKNHTTATKQNFLEVYFECGILREACDRTQISYETAKYWHRSSWFKEDLARMQEVANKATDRKITKLIDKSFAEIDERLMFGEERLTKEGDVIRVKPNLAALTIAAGTLFDKRQILRKAVEVESTADDILERLAEKLRTFNKPMILDAEIVEVNDPT